MLFRSASGKLKGGRHLKFPAGTPATNLFLTMLDKLDIHLDKFGDSTGRLDLDGSTGISV